MQATDFQVRADAGRIVLSGDFLGTTAQIVLLADFLRAAAQSRQAWEIDANDVRLTPEGVSTWIDLVDKFMSSCDLTYQPSHLAAVLQFDSRYRHRATFQEEIAPRV